MEGIGFCINFAIAFEDKQAIIEIDSWIQEAAVEAVGRLWLMANMQKEFFESIYIDRVVVQEASPRSCFYWVSGNWV